MQPQKGRAAAQPQKVRTVVWSCEGQKGMIASEGWWGDRVPYLPDSAHLLIVGGHNYFVDAAGYYYLQCIDDNTLFCVVPDPQ